MIGKHVIPNLVLSQRSLDRMTRAASRYTADETGEAMVGLLVPDAQTDGVPTLYVLDTISPDETAIRAAHTFQQGDELQDEIIWWLQENWRYYRDKRRDSYGNALQAKWDVPLRYLGDWHKQPGYMIKPSFGDLMTALDWLDDPENGMESLLVPIVTLGHPSTTDSSHATVNYLTVTQGDGTDTRVDFWYIHRDLRVFQPIFPTISAEDQLPGLTNYPWHLVNDDRYNTEIAQLHGEGLFTSVILWDSDGKLPLEVCFLTARRGSEKVLIIVTDWDYPRSAPQARLAPFVQMDEDDNIYDIFEELWEQSETVQNPVGWTWAEDNYLIDYIRVVEKACDLRSSEPAAESTPQTAAAPENNEAPPEPGGVIKIEVVDESETSDETAADRTDVTEEEPL